MKSAAKINEIQKTVISASYSIIMFNETSWSESVKNEEVFGSNYNVYRDDRDFQRSEKISGGGVLIAVSSELNSEHIMTTKFDEFEQVWRKVQVVHETHFEMSVSFLTRTMIVSCY